MKNIKTKAMSYIALFTALLILLAPIVAADYPSHNSYIYDGASILSSEDAEQIKSSSESLFSSKNIRLAVCIVENTGSEDADDYAKNIFNEWKISNGALLLIVTEAKNYHAVQSESVKKILTDEKLTSILNESLEPEFVAENYSAGIVATITSVSDYLKENVAEPMESPETDLKDEKNGDGEKSGLPGPIRVILTIIVTAALLLIIGYVVLVILEKRQAEKRRLYLEERRRRMAQNGRGGYSSSLSFNRNGTTHYPYDRNGALPPPSDARTYYPSGERYAENRRVQNPRRAPDETNGGNYNNYAGARYDENSATREFTRR